MTRTADGMTRSIADLLFRMAIGGVLLVHGAAKLASGSAPVVASMEHLGFHPATPVAYLIIFLETAGAIAIIGGFATRLFAICLAVEMAVIAFVVQWPHGFSASKGGYELTLMWSVLFLALAIKGAGRWSLDNAFGWPI